MLPALQKFVWTFSYNFIVGDFSSSHYLLSLRFSKVNIPLKLQQQVLQLLEKFPEFVVVPDARNSGCGCDVCKKIVRENSLGAILERNKRNTEKRRE